MKGDDISSTMALKVGNSGFRKQHPGASLDNIAINTTSTPQTGAVSFSALKVNRFFATLYKEIPALHIAKSTQGCNGSRATSVWSDTHILSGESLHIWEDRARYSNTAITERTWSTQRAHKR